MWQRFKRNIMLNLLPDFGNVHFFKKTVRSQIDIVIFQNSKGGYLTLSLKYRKLLRTLIDTIPFDVIPINPDAAGVFLDYIEDGDVIFER